VTCVLLPVSTVSGRGNLARYSGQCYALVSFIEEDIGMFTPPGRAALPIFADDDSKPYTGATVCAAATCGHPIRRVLSEPLVAAVERPQPAGEPPSRNTLAPPRPISSASEPTSACLNWLGRQSIVLPEDNGTSAPDFAPGLFLSIAERMHSLLRWCIGPMSLSVMPDKADECRRHAQECFEAAERTNHEEERNILLHIAQTWEHLANQEEDTSRTEQQHQVRPEE
jgi:hypothetical protein